MSRHVQFNGPAKYGFGHVRLVCRSVVDACSPRLRKVRRLPSWTWAFTLGTQILKRSMATVFALPDINEARRYLDAVVLTFGPATKVRITESTDARVKGSWFIGSKGDPRGTLLYFHGGGYSFYPKSYANLIASITLAARTRTFALDYRLTPEHRFPAQLEDALAAYQWLLDSGTDPEDLVVAGDSAGGNLTLALLLAARERRLPMPALALALSPATDFVVPTEDGRPSLFKNAEFDWIAREMLLKWAGWFCTPEQRRDPLVSPIYADLRDLCPLYIQAGEAEILFDSIQAFARRAQSQGADIVMESWPDMNHDFQMFGQFAPQSAAALRRIGEVIEGRLGGRKEMAGVPGSGSSVRS